MTSTVTLGVAPDGNGPLTGVSVCALTGTVNITMAEAINRTKAIAAVFPLIPVEKCIFLFTPFNFAETMYVVLPYLRFILREHYESLKWKLSAETCKGIFGREKIWRNH